MAAFHLPRWRTHPHSQRGNLTLSPTSPNLTNVCKSCTRILGIPGSTLFRKWCTPMSCYIFTKLKARTFTLLFQGAVLGHFTACAERGLLCIPVVEVSLSQGKDQTHLQPHLHHLLFASRTPNTQYKLFTFFTTSFLWSDNAVHESILSPNTMYFEL